MICTLARARIEQYLDHRSRTVSEQTTGGTEFRLTAFSYTVLGRGQQFGYRGQI